jgi:hypothetical protein
MCARQQIRKIEQSNDTRNLGIVLPVNSSPADMACAASLVRLQPN